MAATLGAGADAAGPLADRCRASLPPLVAGARAGNLLSSSRHGMGIPVREVLNRSDVACAVAGDESAIRRVVDRLTPVIQGRAARMLLLRRPWGETRGIRQEVEDLTQEVLLALFAGDAKALRDWRPERGLSLERFVGLVAERRITSILRSRRRNPWQERPSEPAALERGETAADPARRAESRQLYRRLLERLRLELSPLGWQLFELMFLEELPVAEVRRRTRLSAAAAYAWRSRLRRAARRLAADLDAHPGPLLADAPVGESSHG